MIMNWKIWVNKKVFIKTQHGSYYNGYIKDIDDSNEKLIWIILIDKFGRLVQLLDSEILHIK